MLHAEHISYKAGQKDIVRNCSLQVQPGTFTAIVGPNGAGKTSLLRIISNEITRYKGTVSINGHAVSKINGKALSLIRAVLPQHTTVNFPFTIEQVIEIGRYAHRTTQAQNSAILEEVIQLTSLSPYRGRTYQTLSGGEQQRVQLARVMAQLWDDADFPKYLLLDEPTSSLDIAQQHALLTLSKSLCKKGIGVLAVLHDLNLASQYADEALFLKGGETIAAGSIHDVMNREVIEETFSYPVEVTFDRVTRRPRVYARSLEFTTTENEPIKQDAYEYSNHG